MNFQSILFNRTENSASQETLEAPGFFVDLNLDQVIDAITVGKEEYNLKPFFHTSLHDAGAIHYRQQVMRDLENHVVAESVKSFAQKMRAMREHLAQAEKLYYQYQKKSWFLDAVEIYCDAVASLVRDLSFADLKSRGLSDFRGYLSDYTRGELFVTLLAETQKLKADLAEVRYCVLIKGDTVTVSKYEPALDYSIEVTETFRRFQQGAVRGYRVKFENPPDMNHIEAKILEFVSQLYPDLFSNLDRYCEKNGNFLDEAVKNFDREIQFYVAYLEHIARLMKAGLNFCYPKISAQRKEVYDVESFDLALAQKLVRDRRPVICNDFYLEGKERIFLVSGPNQGGKTTFARTFGQLHYLASLGCPVPGREAQLFLFDKLFTHFEKEENIKDLRGKLEDDLIRIHAILDQAGPDSIVIINEIFTSTTSQDAAFLSKKIIEKIIQLDLLCVCVSFIDELASLSDKTVSMVSMVVPENPTLRTYKVVRKPADGLAYAIAIAEKYRLTSAFLKDRLQA